MRSSQGPETVRTGRPEEERRLGDRFALTFSTRCLTEEGQISDVWLLDLSRKGCQLFCHAGAFLPGQNVVVINHAGERHSGRVAWAAEMKAGVEFHRLICSDAFAGMLAFRPDPGPKAIDPRPMEDQFGRKLSPLPPLARAYRDRR